MTIAGAVGGAGALLTVQCSLACGFGGDCGSRCRGGDKQQQGQAKCPAAHLGAALLCALTARTCTQYVAKVQAYLHLWLATRGQPLAGVWGTTHVGAGVLSLVVPSESVEAELAVCGIERWSGVQKATSMDSELGT